MRSEEEIRERYNAEKNNIYSPTHKQIANILKWVLSGTQWRDAIKDPPQEEGEYNVYDGQNVFVAYWDKYEWLEEGGHPVEISHWMPLPKLPEASDETGKV